MRISSISNQISSFPNKISKQNHAVKNNNSQSFKGIYIEDIVDLGKVALQPGTSKFLPKDFLLLNEIANEYPNQDCFITKGYSGFPKLEFRERPAEVQTFRKTLSKDFRIELNPADKDYPVVPLLLYDNDNLTRYIGMTSYISLNPSLPYTVMAGYELHKKLIEKKFEILKGIGKTDEYAYDVGDKTIMERAHKEIEDVEIAVTRYLLESAYAALTDRASAQQIYASNYPKVQSRLSEKRKYDLTTSIANRPKIDLEEIKTKKMDICKIAMENYPDVNENKDRIKALKDYMAKKGIVLG